MAEEQQQRVQYPAPLRADNSFAIWSQQVDDILDKLAHRWKGEVEILERGERKWVKNDGSTPLMNDAGIDYAVGQMHVFASRVTFLSSCGTDEIYRIVRVNGLTLTKSLFLNWRKYGIRPHNFEEIAVSITTFFFFAAKRSQNGGERLFLQTTGVQQNINQNIGNTGGFRLWGEGKG